MPRFSGVNLSSCRPAVPCKSATTMSSPPRSLPNSRDIQMPQAMQVCRPPSQTSTFAAYRKTKNNLTCRCVHIETSFMLVHCCSPCHACCVLNLSSFYTSFYIYYYSGDRHRRTQTHTCRSTEYDIPTQTLLNLTAQTALRSRTYIHSTHPCHPMPLQRPTVVHEPQVHPPV